MIAEATGIGSMPGTDPLVAARQIADLCEQMPYLPELPARGVGADMFGRVAALLVDMPMEMGHSAWRLCARPGRDMRLAAQYLTTDLDAAAECFAGASVVKMQVCGPWTLAAFVELSNGHRLLTDRGAIAYLAESMAEGVAAQVDRLRRRLPGCEVILQLDEPGLPAVLDGSLATASGVGTLPPVDRADISAVLRKVIAAVELPTMVHCCHRNVPYAVLRELGLTALAIDMTGMDAAAFEPVAELVEAGVGLLAGLVPSTRPGPGDAPERAGRERAGREPTSSSHAFVRQLLELWSAVGLDPDLLARAVTVTPSCGLAGADVGWARQAMELAAGCGAALR